MHRDCDSLIIFSTYLSQQSAMRSNPRVVLLLLETPPKPPCQVSLHLIQLPKLIFVIQPCCHLTKRNIWRKKQHKNEILHHKINYFLGFSGSQAFPTYDRISKESFSIQNILGHLFSEILSKIWTMYMAAWSCEPIWFINVCYAWLTMYKQSYCGIESQSMLSK